MPRGKTAIPTGARQYILSCRYCDRKFNNERTLNAHLFCSHEKPPESSKELNKSTEYKCQYCSNNFLSKTDLMRHKRLNTKCKC